jgi:CheY-like chemotaxis protein
MIEDILVELGATVVGPAYSIETALEMTANAAFDAALLDINVRGQRIDPVAELLHRGGPWYLPPVMVVTVRHRAPQQLWC